MYKIETKKDKVKLIRSVAEFLCLLVLLVVILDALFVRTDYQPYDKSDTQIVSGDDKGFLALSYLGVDRKETNTLMSTKRLEEHLQALSQQGYVTISQQDILDYYQQGKTLPDKALFLMFEDGRRDTTIFSEKLLEKYNFQATILTYAEKFVSKDSKFLMPDDLKTLAESSWWETGSNGYRLSYINAFDRYGRYLGELTSREYIALKEFMGRDYNHYLMDYIRDEYGLPLESTQAMQRRITYDYDLMEDLYTETLGAVPNVYVLTHANTGMFGNNERVSQVNGENMMRLFSMNFNREGYSRNDRSSSLYDLTRMQPQSYWYTNHLLMRIQDDLAPEDQDGITFVVGDEKRAEDWTLLNGAAEFKGEQIILTSQPEGIGRLALNDSSSFRDMGLEVSLTGNQLGTQTIYLRANEEQSQYIAVSIQNNTLLIRQSTGAGDEELFALDLRELDGGEKVSVEENSQEALVAELDVRAQYSGSIGQWRAYKKEKQSVKDNKVRSVTDGADEYVPEIQINDLGNRKLRIELSGSQLQVFVDGKEAAAVSVEVADAGEIYLESAWGGYGYSQRNIADDVYDGVFEGLKVYTTDGAETILYKNTLNGLQKLAKFASETGNQILNWFIENF